MQHPTHVICGHCIIRENLGLDRDRREVHAPVVIGKIPHANEQKARQRLNAENLFVSPKVRFNGADARHLHPIAKC